VFAVLDESTSELPSVIAYVMTGVVLVADEAAARAAAGGVTCPSRQPSHRQGRGRSRRGPQPDRTTQAEATRAKALGVPVPALEAEGADHLCIESRGTAGDLRDRVVLLDALKRGGRILGDVLRLATDEPALWLDDAVRSAVADFLLRAPEKQHHSARL